MNVVGFFVYMVDAQGALTYEKMTTTELQAAIVAQKQKVYWFTPLVDEEWTMTTPALKERYPLDPAIIQLIEADAERQKQEKQDETDRIEKEKNRESEIKERLAQEQIQNTARRDKERQEKATKAEGDDALIKEDNE